MSEVKLKAIALIKRKADTTREHFQEHYEGVHVPLAVKVFSDFSGYVRNYIATDVEPGFDVFSMFWYSSVDDMAQNYQCFSSAEGDAIREDELSFMDRPENRSFLVRELSDDSAPWSAGFKEPLVGSRKYIVMLSKPVQAKEVSYYTDEIFAQLKQSLSALRHLVHNVVDDENAEIAMFTELWLQGASEAEAATAETALRQAIAAQGPALSVFRVADFQTVC